MPSWPCGFVADLLSRLASQGGSQPHRLTALCEVYITLLRHTTLVVFGNERDHTN